MEETDPRNQRAQGRHVGLLVACADEDHALALASRVAASSGGTVWASSAALRNVVREAATLQPDVLLAEHDPADEQRLWEAIGRVGRISPHTRVVILCRAYPNLALGEFVRRGVSGCVLASAAPEHWAQAVQHVARGEPWFRRTVLLRALRMQLESAPLPPSPGGEEDTPLTAREQEILDLVRNGLSNKEVGRRLEISDQTVKTHLHNIYTKLHQSGRYKILLAQRPESAAP